MPLPGTVRFRPSMFAHPFCRENGNSPRELLTANQKDAIAAISTLVNFERKQVIYRQDDEANVVFNIMRGTVATYYNFENGEEKVSTFLFPRDIFGLCEDGRYVATAKALTPVTAYMIPITQLRSILESIPGLEIGFLTKLCSDLKGAQFHAVMSSRSEVSAKVAAFLLWLQRVQLEGGGPSSPIQMVMTRRDVASYLGLSHESMSRALLFLESAGAILRSQTHSIAVLDQQCLEKLVFPE